MHRLSSEVYIIGQEKVCNFINWLAH